MPSSHRRAGPLSTIGWAVLCFAEPAYAQFTDAHAYDIVPAGTNQLETGYAYAHASASIDPALVIVGAKLNLNQGLVDFTRYFGAFDRLMWVEAGVPVARLDGSISGTDVGGSTTGLADARYGVGFLPATSLGVSLTGTAPTGSYDPDKVLNLGSDRWSFKPEIALRLPFGTGHEWQFDGYANTTFFTDNTSYRGRQILRQEPLFGLEGHLSYAFNDSVWASLDTRYAWRGGTSVDGVDQDNEQRLLVLGAELSASIDAKNALLFEFATTSVHHNAPDATGFSVRYDFLWGR